MCWNVFHLLYFLELVWSLPYVFGRIAGEALWTQRFLRRKVVNDQFYLINMRLSFNLFILVRALVISEFKKFDHFI